VHRLIRRASLVLAATATAALAGCGASGPSDRTQIETIVKEEGVRPASLCHHLTDALLVRFGGLSSCLTRAASAARDPSAHATAIKVHGLSATAVVVDSSGTRAVTLVKQKGVWLVSSVS
jgi:hypothetical protein